MNSEEVCQVLAGTRSSAKAEREAAEAQLQQSALNQPAQFLPSLLAVAEDPRVAVADKQSAMLAFKTCVQRLWSPGFEQFTGPPLTHELRAQLRAQLLELLVKAPEHKVRSVCALVIGQIGSLEYPDQWPDLVKLALQFLGEPFNSPVAAGGLALLKELVLETLREEDFMLFGEQICGRLLEMIRQSLDSQAEGKTSTILAAIQCFHSLVTFLLMGDDDQLENLEQMAARIVPQWVSTLCTVLRREDTALEVVNEAQSTLREMDSAFQGLMEQFLPDVYVVVVDILKSRMRAGTSGQEELLSNFTLLLIMVLGSSAAKKRVFMNNAELDGLCELLVGLSIMDEEALETLVLDYNVFVTDELELETGGLSPRTNAAALVSMTSQPRILTVLLGMLESVPPTAGAQLEALLYLISNVLSQVDLAQPLKLIQPGQLQRFLEVLEFKQFDGPVLSARKMITAAFAAKYLTECFPENINLILATHGFRFPAIEADSTQAVLKCAALRGYTVCATPKLLRFLRPFQEAGLQLVFQLLQTDPLDDTPVFLAEAYGAVLKADYTVVERHSACAQILLQLAALDPTDIDLNAQILDVVGELLDAVPERPVVDSILQPVLTVVEQKGSETGFGYTGELYFALELLTTILSHENLQFTSKERVRMLNSFYQVITATDDVQIMQVASFAYAALVRNLDATATSEIDEQTARNVLQVAARLLSPDLDDSAALASGKLVSAIIDQFGDSLGELLPELLVACAKRLSSAKNALLVETLVMVFCELTLRNASAVVNILSDAGMLQSVMNQWIPTFEVTIGADNIRKQIKALQLLFELQDPRLSALMVPDEPIKKLGEVITRRKAKNLQFTKVSVPVKILKLLIRELAQAGAMEQRPKVPKNDDSDDEWDDELVVTEDGEFFDQVAYQMIAGWLRKLSRRPEMAEYYSKLNSTEHKILAETFS